MLPGPADAPDAVLALDDAAVAALVRGDTTPGAAVRQGVLAVSGDTPLAEALRAAG
ncbi:SCP2 sterol-binding domain-containing protein [Streptomyces sp. NPDC001380]|uniref:SCP2 sterol-binding domain-containing protein n=1 Tax=Streptomyces sp. NPDC001380 TaxID=3364566 RepID=UPI0036793837